MSAHAERTTIITGTINPSRRSSTRDDPAITRLWRPRCGNSWSSVVSSARTRSGGRSRSWTRARPRSAPGLSHGLGLIPTSRSAFSRWPDRLRGTRHQLLRRHRADRGGEHRPGAQPDRLYAVLLLSATGPRAATRLVQTETLPGPRRERATRVLAEFGTVIPTTSRSG